MNSSHSWKSGERCRVTGSYRCQNCHYMGRETLRDFQANAILPMCDSCPDKDVSWLLARPADSAVAGA